MRAFHLIRILLCLLPLAAAKPQAMSIAGTWALRLDADRSGHAMKWATQPFLGDTIFLPGSTDQGGYGLKFTAAAQGRLTRPWIYEGAAWYQREVIVPEAWRDRRITLFLERPHWQTEVWVDDRALGSQNSLTTPHVYDLGTPLPPGRHRITICVDNSYLIDVGREGHGVTDESPTNWNGIVGRIELRATDRVWVDSVRIDPQAGTARIEAVVRNSTGAPVNGELVASLPGRAAKSASIKFAVAGTEERVTLNLPLDGLRAWDEYAPSLYELRLALTAGAHHDVWSGVLAFREFGTRGKQFVLNGRPIFLRGTVECATFPLTGYPPTTVEGWERLFRIARSYGLNHLRFHSWCPPEAAFTAADQAGFLLHVELPVWRTDMGPGDDKLRAFMRAEAYRILREYGNHPSFAMLAMGNELKGDWPFLDGLVAELKRADSRRLYTFSPDCYRGAAGPSADYYVSLGTKSSPIRINGSRFGNKPGGTDYDFSANVAETPVPLVAHELGQWAVYPDYDEIGKYSGVLKPRNLEFFRQQLDERGMADQDKAFQQATGKFSWLVYKEDIESTLRTPGFGGAQILQLQDFPGQREALVGLLDSFWETKGILSPAQVRQFFSETVPLLRFAKFTWTNDETLRASAQVAHYSKAPLVNAVFEWAVSDETGAVRASGKLTPRTVAPGNVTALGEIAVPLAGLPQATRLRIELRIPRTEIQNGWDIWVYPKIRAPEDQGSVTIAHQLDAATLQALRQGGKVLLLWPAGTRTPSTMATRFLPIFWSGLSFRQPGTMGILCDPQHPALAGFPTEEHNNWQWWELMQRAPAFILDETPPGFRPLVQVIDDFHRHHKLGAVFETRVGAGSLLVSSLDLESELSQRPVATQLRRSLLAYMNSPQFQPAVELNPQLLERLMPPAAQPR